MRPVARWSLAAAAAAVIVIAWLASERRLDDAAPESRATESAVETISLARANPVETPSRATDGPESAIRALEPAGVASGGASAAGAPGADPTTDDETPGRIVGRLVDENGDAVPGARVSLAFRETDQPSRAWLTRNAALAKRDVFTDAEGTFELRDVSPGAYWIGPSAFQRTFPPIAAPLSIPASGGVVEATVHVTGRLAITGRVVDRAGAPIAGVMVRASWDRTDGELEAATSMDGAFELSPLPPGDATLRVDTFGRPRAGARVAAGTSDVVLVVDEWRRVAGRVVDAGGRPVRARVSLLARERPFWTPDLKADAAPTLTTHGRRSVVTQASTGAFEFGGELDGSYALIAAGDSERGMAYLREIRMPDGGSATDIELRLEPTAMVRVESTGAALCSNLEAIQDGVAVVTRSMGLQMTLDVPPGPTIVRLSVPPDTSGGSAARRVEANVVAVAGETRSIFLPPP
ncbi:MAG TPA: carboxypeptidase-like regulatory domain-containing protein [Planctomycetota bacterium]|nr:carboxypeptidase-like regulatory domain-containing protein [Planctomycetota bacterium]